MSLQGRCRCSYVRDVDFAALEVSMWLRGRYICGYVGGVDIRERCRCGYMGGVDVAAWAM